MIMSPIFLSRVGCLLGLIIFPFFADQFYIQFVSKVLIMAILASSLNLLVGYTGLVSLGHAAFYGLAGYALAIATTQYAITGFWINLFVSLTVTSILGFFIGALVVRTRGIYFIMVTLAFAQLLFFIFHDTDIAGGSDGVYIYNIPQVTFFGYNALNLSNPTEFYFLSLITFILVIFSIDRITKSLFGQVISGIKINESRVESLGFQAKYYKLTCFVISSFIAALAGFLAALQFGLVNPDMLGWHMSGGALVMVLLGGMGTLFGPTVGALVMLTLELILQSLTNHWQIFVGSIVILVAIFLPNGIVSALRLPYK